jgi:UDP-2,4-diacetamido-2,4,6-trideoxy-beta-L-altropyranose hydrolase
MPDAPMRVAIRTDASNLIGTGHVMRCLSLAAALRAQGAEVEFLIRNHPGNLVQRIRESGFAVNVLDSPSEPGESLAGEYERWLAVPWQVDADETQSRLQRNRPDWLIVDHYGLNECWEMQVRSSCRALMVIDDLIERTHFCDLLVDPNLPAEGSPNLKRNRDSSGEFLCGPRYAMLDQMFRQARRHSSDAETRPHRLVIFFGGSDATNETAKVLSALEQFPQGAYDVDVVAGALNSNIADLKSRCEKLGYRLNLGARMPDLYASADLALGAPGTSSWERMCVGIPTVLTSVASNQERIGEALERAGCAFYLGRSCNVTAEDYAGILRALRFLPGTLKRQARLGQEMVDGRGTERIAGRMLHWWVELRAARMDDSRMIHQWRNSPEVRHWSGNCSPTAFDDHDRWMRRTLNDPERILLVGEVAGNAVGVVRFDCVGEESIISIFLNPEKLGNGIGPALLRNAHLWLARQQPNIRRIVAEVLAGNNASEYLFCGAGYQRVSSRFVLTVH